MIPEIPPICTCKTPTAPPPPRNRAVGKRLLNGRGACRVHGGGFAGAVQAYVPLEMAEEFRRGMEEAFGEGAFHPLRIRPCGAYCMSSNW